MNIRNESTIDTIPEVQVQAYGQSVYVSWTPVLVRSEMGYVSYELQVNASHEDVANEDQWHDPSQTDAPQYDTYVRLRETVYTDSTQRFFTDPGATGPGTTDPVSADPVSADPGAADPITPSGTTSTIQRRVVPVHYRVRVVVETSDPVAIQDEDGNDTGETTNIIAFSEWSEAVTVLISPLDYQDLNAGSISSDSFASESVISEHIKTGKIEANTSTNWEGENSAEGSEIDLASGSAKFRTYRPDEGSVSEVRISDDAASSGVVEHGIVVEDKLVEGVAPFSPVRTEDGDIITQENFPGWDFDDTWEMREGAWPKLQWQSEQTGVGNTEEAQGAHTLIRSAADLQKVRDDLDGNFRLENDIELSGAFEPIGSEENPFVGVFDGNGKTISGLQIAETDKAGFFAQIGYPEDDYEDDDEDVYQQGFVRNLNLVLVDGDAENPSIAGSAFAGAVAGRNYGRIEAVEVSGGSIQGSAEESRAGGIVGENSGYIKDVTISSNITASEADAVLGGIAGRNSGWIDTATVSSEITGSGADAVLGGVAGENSGRINAATVNGDITGSEANVILGGLAGENTGSVDGGTLDRGSTLTASGESVFLGGIAGKNGGYINDSTVRGDTIISSGTNAVLGGFAGENTGYINSGRGSTGITASGTGSVLGGIAGENSGCLRDMVSGETGNITASGTESVLGGIAGKNSGQIDEGRVVRSIIGDETDAVLGGVAGENEGDINGSTFSGSLERDGQELTDVLIGSNIEAADITYELINNGADLQKIRDNLAGTFKLANDITLRDAFDPIGSKDDPFVGILEGNGNTIIGLQIAQADEDYVGFFVQIGRTGSDEDYDAAANGLVRNLKLELIDGNGRNPSITGKKYVGALAGANRGRIENCSAERGVIRGNDRLGGLVGLNSSGSITNSSADISIELNESIELTGNNENKSYLCLGGLVGCNFSGSITNSYARGSIELNESIELTGENIELINLTLGGLVGDNNGSISNSEADGLIELDESIELSGNLTRDNLALRFGGLAGLNHDSIINSQANGSVAISGDSVNCRWLYLGGLAGVSASSRVTNSTARGDVSLEGNTVRSKSLNLGGLVGRNSESRTKNSVSYGSVRLSGDTVQYTGLYSGGLTGWNEDSSITNSKASGGVTMGDSTELSADNAEDSTYLDFAGLVGSNKDSRISNSSAGGEIDLNGSVSLNGSPEGHNRLRLGGLVGWNNGKITANHANASVKISGTITEDTIYMRLGGLVGTNSGSIINDIASGGVELTGSATLGGTVEDSNYLQLGGLVGRNYDNGRIVNGSVFEASELNGPIKLSGSVTLNGSNRESNLVQLGGLAGNSSGSIIKSSANKSITLSGTVELTGAGTSSNSLRLGGLIGEGNGSITKSSASGAVTLREGTVASRDLYLGGLAGYSRVSITYSSASGAVILRDGIITSSYAHLGGLVGYSSGNIINSSASGEVRGSGNLGGLVGESYGDITNSSASGEVSGSGTLGGLVGSAFRIITNSSASGEVSGSRTLGGLVGYSWATIQDCMASGEVSGSRILGGLVGWSQGEIRNSSASGDVTGIRTSDTIGRLVGIGGLVGLNWQDIESSYAIGAVSGASYLGSLVGKNLASGAIQTSYFDVKLTGQSRGVGSDEGESSIGHYYSLGIPRLGETKLNAFGLAMASPYGANEYGIHLKGIYPDQEESKERDLRISTNTGISHTATVDGENKMLHDTMHPLQTVDISYLGHLHWINSDAFSNNVTIYNNTSPPRIAWTAVEALSIAGTRGVLVRVNASWYSRHNNTSELKVWLRPLGASWTVPTNLPVSGLQGSHWGSRNTQYVSKVIAVPVNPESRKFEFFTDYFGGTGSLNITQIGVYI